MNDRAIAFIFAALFIILAIQSRNRDSEPVAMDLAPESMEITEEDEKMVQQLADEVYADKLKIRDEFSFGFEYDFQKQELWSIYRAKNQKIVWKPAENMPFCAWCIIVFLKFKESGRPKPVVKLGKFNRPDIVRTFKALKDANVKG